VSACLLDTSALLAHYRAEAGADRVQELLEDDGVDLALSAVTVTEFARRVAELGAEPNAARDAALQYARLVTEVVPVDAAVAIRAFEISATASGRVPLVDALIAACASVLGATLVHRDPHFQSIGAGLVASESL